MCESYINIMEDLLTCRVCLTTGGKLFNMYNYSLKNVYESLTGICVSIPDPYPHYLCNYCQRLLVKSNKFKEQCLQSQELLRCATMEISTLTLDHIQTISLTKSSTKSLSIPPDETFIHPCPETPIKEETLDILLKEEEEEDLTDQSDEEPLAKKAIKKKKKTINYSEFEFDDSIKTVSKNIECSEFENDSFAKEIEFSDFEFDNGDFETVDFQPKVVDADNFINIQDIEVIILTKEEQIQEILARKSSYNYQNSFYKCEFCYKGFMTDVTFKNHMIRHDPSTGPHSCDICHTQWPDQRSLKAHTTTSHERKYICKLCTHTCKSCHRAKEHLKWHKGHTFDCKVCGASFAKSTSYLTHVRLRHPSQFSCDICGESFIGQNGLNMHKKKAHRGYKETNTEVLFTCVLCNARFKNIEALKQHTDVSDNGVCDTNLSPCTHCGLSFTSRELLKEHQKIHQKEEVVRCDECSRVFSHARSLGVHRARVHGAGAGGGGAGAGGARRARARVVRHRAPVVCEMCGKKCISNATLIYHQRTHTGEKPYQCTQCHKTFSVYQRLQIHIRTHTGERPFKCSHCPKAFKHKAALNRHTRVHTGVKPYQCSHCTKSFSQSNSMKLHVRTVHLKMPAPYRNRRNNKISES